VSFPVSVSVRVLYCHCSDSAAAWALGCVIDCKDVVVVVMSIFMNIIMYLKKWQHWWPLLILDSLFSQRLNVHTSMWWIIQYSNECRCKTLNNTKFGKSVCATC